MSPSCGPAMAGCSGPLASARSRSAWLLTAPTSGWRTSPATACRNGKGETRRKGTGGGISMKRFVFALTIAMVVTVVAGPAPAQAQLKFNPNQVAILRWYQANQTAFFILVGA